MTETTLLAFLAGLIAGAVLTYLIGVKRRDAPAEALRNPSKYKRADPEVARTLDEHDRDLAATDPRWVEGEVGELATFTYADRDGVVTERRVSNWRSLGAYIEGVCVNRQEERTFRKDRITGWSVQP
ncbi:hypothetical protein [Asticcacaulis excentricus]|uniref:Uncharacterized protein n=1 Tax=Asticcacaulis excentricus (strain ATCC 15261 / DSM 4724 / KCTC 12464 / NCIMB 9791 / VKM B-1370 / CB 48) TaxID=573065 RepID=E8RM48_ASTEC|nr:hypothetical protein [Asticcacaulis excentricus]ADU12740.1 hypothetical protein Astex_1061 [Asticcacaulis excentricus CB 48]